MKSGSGRSSLTFEDVRQGDLVSLDAFPYKPMEVRSKGRDRLLLAVPLFHRGEGAQRGVDKETFDAEGYIRVLPKESPFTFAPGV